MSRDARVALTAAFACWFALLGYGVGAGWLSLATGEYYWVSLGIVCICAGYGLGRLYAWRLGVQRDRERIVESLAGTGLPAWEQKARQLEDEADRLDGQCLHYAATKMRGAADRRRKLGRLGHG